MSSTICCFWRSQETEEITKLNETEADVRDRDGAGAIFLDSGTGESKIIFVDTTEGGQVVVEELKVLPSLKDVHKEPNADAILTEFQDSVKEALDSRPGAAAYAGMTAWFRGIPENEKQSVRDFFNTRLPQLKLLELTGIDEALYEAAAVNYAAEMTGLGKPVQQLAAGGGSVNIIYLGSPFSIATGFRAGQAKIKADGLVALKECEKDATAYIDAFIKANPAFNELKEGSIIAISACYYAAKGTGLAGDAPTLSEDVVRVFEERKAALIEKNTDSSLKDDKKASQEMANMILQTQVFKRLTHPKAKVYFRRDWTIDGVNFRTTWTTGYYILKILNSS